MSQDKSQSEPKDFSAQGVKTLLGNPKRAIIKLAIPMMVAWSVQTLYNVVDALWVSGLGPDALSAVGFFFPFFFLLMALAGGLGMGGSSALSRKIGAKDKAGADQIATHTMVLMFISAVVVTIPFLVFIEDIFIWMGAEHVAPAAAAYSRIIFAGTLVIFFANNASALLRGEGDVKRAMVAMLMGSGLNIILDPIFIYVLDLGVKGAAWATLISLVISTSFLFYWLFIKRDTFVTIRFKRFRFKLKIIKDILRVGIPSTIMHMSMSLSILLLNILVVKVGGTDGIAVYTTGWRVATFAILPLFGIATAVTSVTGAAYGAKNYPKLATAFYYAIRMGVVIEIVVAALTYILAPEIVALFTTHQESIRIRHDMIVLLRIMCIYYPATAFGMLSSSLFQGTAKGTNALIVTIFRTVILAVPLAYLFAIPLNNGLTGVWWGITAGNILAGIIAFAWAGFHIKSLQKTTPSPQFTPAQI